MSKKKYDNSLRVYKTKRRKVRVLQALAKSYGIVTPALKAARVSRTAYYTWMNEDPVFREKVATIQEVDIDRVRTKLGELVDNGDPGSVRFYLTHKAKEFKKTIEVTGKDGGPVELNAIFNVDLVKPPKE